MERNKDDVFFIVNPHAGNGKGLKDWPVIESFLKRENVSYQYVFTGGKLHAIELSEKAAAEGSCTIIAVGGDGTLNEVANGILKSKNKEVVTGMIPVGSGNDWCRMFDIPFEYKRAVKIIKGRKIFTQDVGKIRCKKGQDDIERFFVNIAGLGFDAKVVQKTNHQKDHGHGGKLLYLLNLFTSLFSKNVVDSQISIDGEEMNVPLFSMNVGICKYNGGGMMQVPNAIADDGLFDITVIRKIGRFDVIKNVKNLYDGSFVRHKKVKTFRGQKVIVNANGNLSVEIDGESLGHAPAEFSILPKALKIIYA